MTQVKQEEKFVVALELGSSRAKIGIAGFNPDDKNGTMTVYRTESLPTLDSIRYGRITNIREVTETVTSLIYEIDGKYPIEGRKISGIIVSIGGRTLRSHRIGSHIVLPERREITEELVARLRDEAVQNLSTPGELISVEPVRTLVDNLVSPRPVGSLGTRLKGEFTAVVCHASNRDDLLDVVDNRAKLNISGLTVTPIALANLVLTPQETNAGCMLVDFGAETTTVAIYKKYALQYLATIPIGSRLITRDISTILSLTEEEAEELKINMGDALPETSASDSKVQETLNAVICTRLCDIIGNIAEQPKYADIKSLPGGIILAGGGAKLRNFARLLSEHTKYNIRMATLPADIVITDSTMTSTDYLDLIAVLKEGVEMMRQDPDAVCVESPKPSPSVHKTETVRTPASVPMTEIEEDVFLDFTSSGVVLKNQTGQTVEINPQPRKQTVEPSDDPTPDYTDFTVIDTEKPRTEVYENEAESLQLQDLYERQAAIKKAEEERIRAEKEADARERERLRKLKKQLKLEKEQEKVNKVNTFDKIINRFSSLIQGSKEDHSRDMDD